MRLDVVSIVVDLFELSGFVCERAAAMRLDVLAFLLLSVEPLFLSHFLPPSGKLLTADKY
jgi:hypothetical protein